MGLLYAGGHGTRTKEYFMKNMKQTKTYVLMMALFMTISIGSAYAQNSEADFKVTLTKDLTGVVINEYIGKATTVRFPATIQGMPVREINGFSEKHITSVVIPDSVTSIGHYAFSDSAALTSVTIPNSVTSIGDGAFQNCTALKSIILPEGLTSIAAFSNCTALISVTIPKSVTSIGGFGGCTALKSIILPEGLTSIDDLTFRDCTALTSIVIPKSVTSIGGGAFEGSGLTSITWPGQVTTIKTGVNRYYRGMFGKCKNLQTVVISEGVTTIEQIAFYGCTALTSITLPSTIQTIEDKVFSGCTALTTITIPESVKSISFRSSDDTFEGCGKLPLATQAVLRRLGYRGSF